MCLHFDAGRSTCAGPIVDAHTVQRKLLKRIARKGEVYQIDRDPTSFFSSGGRVSPRLMGVSKASTVRAFCQHHDSATFRSIETGEIECTAEHAALIGYRANCYELYAKDGVVSLEESRRKWDSRMPVELQVAYQELNNAATAGARAGLADIRRANRQYGELLRAGAYAEIRYLAVRLDSVPDVMCSGGKNPQFDFEGNEIQDFSDLDVPAHGLSFSLLASGQTGCAFFTWLPDDDAVCIPFVSSFSRLSDTQIPHALVRIAFGHIENLYWRPEWWDSLFSESRDRLLERVRIAAHPEIAIPRDFLCEDGLRVVRWRVNGRQTNVSL